MPAKLPIHVSDHKAYVWDVRGAHVKQNRVPIRPHMFQSADIEKLRSEHRICGLLTGTLPHLSQQNIFLGVPLNLMPEEVVLLVENRESFI